MREIRVLNVYKWATMGGVERVFLNRAHAFKDSGRPVLYDVYFLHDSGGVNRFQSYIRRNCLEKYIRVVDRFNEHDYDLILSVDTPEILDRVSKLERVFFECHTGYKDNRTYIKRLPSNIGGLLVPSNFFKEDLKSEVPNWLSDKIYTLTNFVALQEGHLSSLERIWRKFPVIYVGRLDKLKNVEETIQIVAHYKQNIGDDCILVLAGPIIHHEFQLNVILDKYDIRDRVVYLPPIDFENVHKLYEMAKAHKGVFISSSTNETFGLSAAEAIVNGLPVLLSNIEAHNELIEHDEKFTYSLGNIEDAILKLNKIYSSYDSMTESLKHLSRKFTQEQFLIDWDNFIGGVLYEMQN